MKKEEQMYWEYLKTELPFKNPKSLKFELNYYLSTLNRAEKIFDILNYFVKIDLKNKKVLDAGCGSGGISLLLSKRNVNCIGIDSDTGRINLAKKIAKQKGIKAKFVAGDLNKNAFQEGSFDIITAIDFIEHVDSRKMILTLMKYLNKEGMLIFKINNFLFPYEPHIKVLFLHYLPTRLIDSYLRIFYADFFRHYSSYEEIKIPTYFELKRILEGFDFEIFPIFYPFLPDKRHKILNKIFTSKIMNLFGQSWIVVCKHKK